MIVFVRPGWWSLVVKVSEVVMMVVSGESLGGGDGC